MKKILFLAVFSLVVLTVNAQLKVNSEGHVQVDYLSGGQLLTFGPNAGSGYPEWGKWSIEDFNGGLNFYKAWPYSDYGNYKLFLKDNGYIGINDGTPSYRLDVNGDIATYGTLRISSDKRFKTDIKPISSSLNNLRKLNGVSYKMKKEKSITYDLSLIKDKNRRKAAELEMLSQENIKETDRYGFIAQELREVYPELVDEDADGYLNVDYIGLIPVLVEAIKEQQAQIDEIQAQLEDCCTAKLKSATIGSDQKDIMGENIARLDQNIPNPFNLKTKINCYIPNQSNTADLYIYNIQGNQLQQYKIIGTGWQTVTINGSSLTPGMYLYTLVVDGKEIDTKRMILTK